MRWTFSYTSQTWIGKRYLTLGAGLCIIVGVIIIGTANSFTQALVGEVIAGAGGGVCELTALAGYVHRILSYPYTVHAERNINAHKS